MTNLQVPDELAEQIESFAHRTGESQDHLLREAILMYLEDREDAIIAADRLQNVGSRISLEEIGRKYGLAD